MKKAVIVGCNGQDGKIATDYLSKKNYQIIGMDVDTIAPVNVEWNEKILLPEIKSVSSLVEKFLPDEIR